MVWGRRGVAQVCALLSLIAVAVATAQPTEAADARVSGTVVISGPKYHFGGPEQVLAAGGHIWVINVNSDYLTGISETNGGLFKAITGGPYQLGDSPAFAPAGSDMWTSYRSGLVELSGATGKVLRSIHVAGAWGATSMQVVGDDLWLVESPAMAGGGGRVEEVNLASGRVVRRVGTQGNGPSCLEVVGKDVWVMDQFAWDLEEYSTTTGVRVRTVSLPGSSSSDAGYPPLDMAVQGPNLWVPLGTQVVGFGISTGRLAHRLTGSTYGFDTQAVTSEDRDLWFPNLRHDSVTKLDETNGAAEILRGARYQFGLPTDVLADDGSVWVTNADDGNPNLAQDGSLTVFTTSTT